MFGLVIVLGILWHDENTILRYKQKNLTFIDTQVRILAQETREGRKKSVTVSILTNRTGLTIVQRVLTSNNI